MGKKGKRGGRHRIVNTEFWKRPGQENESWWANFFGIEEEGRRRYGWAYREPTEKRYWKRTSPRKSSRLIYEAFQCVARSIIAAVGRLWDGCKESYVILPTTLLRNRENITTPILDLLYLCLTLPVHLSFSHAQLVVDSDYFVDRMCRPSSWITLLAYELWYPRCFLFYFCTTLWLDWRYIRTTYTYIRNIFENKFSGLDTNRIS